MSDRFNAIVAEEVEGKPRVALKQLSLNELPEHDVLVQVACSTLNYKDGLALSGKGRIVRKYPMVCGIDLAGTVVESASLDWKKGDRVVVNGWGLSESQWGGYSQFQRVKSDWLVRLPDAFTFDEAMAIGTAGYTAMLCVMALERAGVGPGGREVIVTGAAGGVGSVAVALLARLGHQVIASTGRPETHGYLRELGAAGFVDRAALAEKGAPLQKERWAGGIDSVGGQTLATVLAQTAYGGAVAACGLAGGTDLPATVFPFILRGVSLLGVDSVMAPKARRVEAWNRLARDLAKDKLAAMTTRVPMSRLIEMGEQIVRGQVRGRVVVDVNA
jgi:acrylyl-CoA reductase (NADPH)